MAYLRCYLNSMATLRPADSGLFLSFTIPHHPASGDTITNSIVTTMTHSNVCLMAAARGIPLEQISAAANWSSATTLQQSHHRDIVAEALALATNVALPKVAKAASDI